MTTKAQKNFAEVYFVEQQQNIDFVWQIKNHVLLFLFV